MADKSECELSAQKAGTPAEQSANVKNGLSIAIHKTRNALRPIRRIGDIAEVPLSNGSVAVIDAADIPLVEMRNWTRSCPQRRQSYAFCRLYKDKKSIRLTLHGVIMQPPPGYVVDHIDGDGLNNRRLNLRLATLAENARNRRLDVDSRSGLKGVTWHKKGRKWNARINVGGQIMHLGLFETADAAHAAYMEAANFHFGEFARAT
jgi:hypothetical protein